MNLYKELEEQGYIRENGMVAHHPTEFCENYFLFSAVALLIAYAKLDLISADKINENFFKYLEKCYIEQGLYHRDPNRTDRQISHDEIIGISIFSFLPSYFILKRGKEHFYSYDNVGKKFFTWKSFFGRFPFFIYYINEMGGNRSISITSKIKRVALKGIFLIDMLITALGKKDNISGKQLYWVMLSEVRLDFPFAYKLWKLIMNYRYKDLSEMLGYYYKYEKHPIVEAAKGMRF